MFDGEIVLSNSRICWKLSQYSDFKSWDRWRDLEDEGLWVRDVMWCDVMWCDVMWCDVMWCEDGLTEKGEADFLDGEDVSRIRMLLLISQRLQIRKWKM